MRARVLTVAVLGLLGGCIDREFLRGAPCGDDRDCDRSLPCEQRVCGGCPPEVPVVEGHCACPGDRVLDCRLLDAPHCMPVCRSAKDLCEVVEVSNGSIQVVPSCTDTSAERCFEVVFDTSECPDGVASIRLRPEESDVEIVVNCPPPESDESHFDCEPP
jgi:hypothetical protein